MNLNYQLYINRQNNHIILRDEVRGRGTCVWASKETKYVNGYRHVANFSNGWNMTNFIKLNKRIKILPNKDVTFRKNGNGDLLIECDNRKVIIGKDRFGRYSAMNSIKPNKLYVIHEERNVPNQDPYSYRPETFMIKHEDIWSEPLIEIILGKDE